MRDPELDHVRAILQEAFTAGWQAALAVNITSPRVLAVIESCFDLWLQEAVDQAEILGLIFRGREDLPRPSLLPVPPFDGSGTLEPPPVAGDTSVLPLDPTTVVLAPVPDQRT